MPINQLLVEGGVVGEVLSAGLLGAAIGFDFPFGLPMCGLCFFLCLICFTSGLDGEDCGPFVSCEEALDETP